MAEAISLCWIAMEMICEFLLFECFMEHKKWKKYSYVLILAALVWILWFSEYYTGSVPIAFLTPATYFILSFFFYNGQWQRRIMAALMASILLTVIDAIVVYIWCALLRTSMDVLTQHKYAFLSAGIVSKFSALFVAWLLYRFFSKTTEKQLQIRWLVLTLLFPAISYIFLFVIVLNSRNESDMSLRGLAITLSIAIANVGTMYMITLIEKSEKASQRVALLNQQMDIQTENILSLEQSYHSQRAVSHEFTHHMNTISSLLEKQQYEIASQYIRDLQEKQTSRVFVVNSHHPIVDAILNQKYQAAKEHGIDMQIRVSDLAALSIPTEKVVVILSNLLDNAIEACERYSGEKAIQLSMILADKMTLSIRNTTEPVQIVNGIPRTTKPDKQNHGYGLQNVERLLNDMKAEHAWSYQDNWFSFVAEIPIT